MCHESEKDHTLTWCDLSHCRDALHFRVAYRCGSISESSFNGDSEMLHLDMPLGHGTPFNLKINLACTQINGNRCSCGHEG